MTGSFDKAAEHLREITECPICMNVFTDPRVLPCIHTFCVECLNRTGEAEQKKPGDKMPCPLCRKEFVIPEEGMHGVQKNYFMENFLEFKTALQLGSSTIICEICNMKNDGKTAETPKATLRCMECQEYYCEDCAKTHHFQKATKDHQMINIGSDMKSEVNRFVSVKHCTKHIRKPLDYYCADCKKIVCVSCLVESHKLHDCKDVTTVDEEYRQTIEKKASKMSTYVNEMLLMRNNNEKTKTDFLTEIVAAEKDIHKRSQELKDMIDRHTKSLLDELSAIKSNQLKEIENHKDEIVRYCTILKSFEAYCTELRSKGSASDICSSVDQIILRADELEKDHEAFIGRPHKLVEVPFHATDLTYVLQNASSNIVVKVEEITSQCQNFAVVVALDDAKTITEDIVQINLHKPNEISIQEEIPTTMQREAVAAVYDNTMYVAGIGHNADEIWKYNITSGWMECASLVQGRRRHSAAFIDEVLYIWGGFVDFTKLVLDSVEAFNAVTNTCTTVGKLTYAVEGTGNCVPYRSILYIFGGCDKDNREVSHVQVYNTKENACSLISKPMPISCLLMRAVTWETSVVLLGCYTCSIFNIETETWEEREQFKTDVNHFGLVLENGRLFVIGVGAWEEDEDGAWILRDDVRYVPLQNIIDDKPIEWKIHGRLQKSSRVYAYANMRIPV